MLRARRRALHYSCLLLGRSAALRLGPADVQYSKRMVGWWHSKEEATSTELHVMSQVGPLLHGPYEVSGVCLKLAWLMLRDDVAAIHR